MTATLNPVAPIALGTQRVMTGQSTEDHLPAFGAIDAIAVDRGDRPAASLQLDRSFFIGQRRARATFGDVDDRRDQLDRDWQRFQAIELDLASFSRTALLETSEAYREQLLAIPTLERLQTAGGGRSVVVPEWLRRGSQLDYGARWYRFPEDTSTPSAAEIVRANVESVIEDDFATFARFQGELLGYPECCIDFFQARSDDRLAPEVRSVKPLVEYLEADALPAGPTGSVHDVVPDVLEADNATAVFTREFYPEPGCERAQSMGQHVMDGLRDQLPSRLVDEHWTLNNAISLLEAHAVHRGGDRRPEPGVLGREHLRSYWPLTNVIETIRGESDDGQ